MKQESQIFNFFCEEFKNNNKLLDNKIICKIEKENIYNYK